MSASDDREQIVREGPDGGAVVLFLLPLFEEANRLRRTVRMAMRELAARDIASMLPDLPGQNESLVPTSETSLERWRDAVARLCRDHRGSILIASIRGGALIDNCAATAHWRLAPVRGASLLKTMMRSRIASDRESGLATAMADLEAQAATSPLRLAGNLLSVAMIAQLRSAEPFQCTPCRVVMLGDGEDEITGRPLWLQAEPGEDAAMASAMAKDIGEWMVTCGIS